MRIAVYAGIASLPMHLVACGGAPSLAPSPPKPRTIELQVHAAADLNPNRDGRPSPVVLTVLVLRDTGAFSSARFEALGAGAADTSLGGSVLGREQRIVRPGESTTLPIRIDPEAGYLGAVAEFADLEGADWRAVMAAPEKRLLDLVSRKSIVLELGRERVQLRTSD